MKHEMHVLGIDIAKRVFHAVGMEYVITGYCYAETLKQERSRIMTRIKGWLSSQGR